MTETPASPPPDPRPAGARANDKHWQPAETTTHEDPLLDALVAMTHLHGRPFSPEALAAGLPLVDNRLTPSLLPRAAARAGLTARIVRKPLADIGPALLPAILLLHDRQACVLLEHLPGGGARVRFPEAGESAHELGADELAALYTGLVCFVRPRFRFEARAPQVRPPRASHWFWGTVAENWRLYRDTLLAALVINLFALAIPMFSMSVYDRVVPNHALETLWVLAVGAVLVLGFDFMLRTLRAYIVDSAGKRIDVQLSARIMEKVLGLRMDARPASVGSFAANLRAFEGVRDFIASATVTTLIDLPFVLLFLLVMLWISPWLLLPPVVGILLVLGVTLLTQGKMHELTETTYRASAQRNATLVESLVGLETVKTLGAESQIQRQWERASLFIAQIGGRLKLLSAGTVNLAQFMQQLVNVAVIIVGVYELANNNMSMGGIIAASMLSGRAMAPLGQVAGLMMQYQNARTSLASVNTHMELPVERPDGASFVHRPGFKGDIEFKDVSFRYPGRDQAVLKKVSFRLRAGEKVGIIGRIGSGKTTIEKLVLGLYPPTKGAVLIDGTDVRGILAGHLHYSSTGTFAGVPVSVASSTCYAMNVARPAEDVNGMDAAQAFQLVHVYPDTITHTVVPVVDAPTGTFFSAEWLERMAAAQQAPPQTLAQLDWSDPAPLDGLALQGEVEWVSPYIWLLDNQAVAGEIGYDVIIPVRAGDARPLLLVNLGWVPAPASRQQLPRPVIPATLELDGLLRIAPGGVLLGQNIESGPYPNRLQSIRVDALSEILGSPLADAVFYQRHTPFLYHYQPNVMPPEKHRAYAVQWLGLALVMLVGGLVLTRRLSP